MCIYIYTHIYIYNRRMDGWMDRCWMEGRWIEVVQMHGWIESTEGWMTLLYDPRQVI